MDLHRNDTNRNEANDTANGTVPYIASPFKLIQEDSSWIVSNAFIIFTMQTGIV